MSLNGLDDPKVQEAHEAAVAEPGGWFLLKYASRDEVELLGRGSGGVVEVRNNVAEYEETSPLYGFLRYRRRNVVIKYLPEDCSRLIQARVAVHFNAVCDRFSPYDTIFEITEAKELKDTKLSAACSLHAASGSNSSSSSSLRRRRLMEIAEEEEEEQQQRATKRQSVAEDNEDGDIRPKTAKTSHDTVLPTETVTLNSELAASPEHSKFTDASTSEVPNFVGADDRPVSPSQSEAQPRMSSQSGRPDLYSYSSYNYGKPKVKLGPRPSLDTNGRPRTAGAYRPVSQMPSGFKLFGKGSKKEKNRDGPATAEDTSVEDKDTVTEQDGLQIVHTELTRPATSSGVSIPGSPVLPMPPPAKPTISPEKARLMKAMKLREKKKANMAAEVAGAPSPPLESPGPSDGDSSTDRVEDHETQHETESDHPSISNADSGIGLDASSASMNNDQTSDLAQTDSHPDSPVIASSEPEISTKASSLSESTDETLHPKNEDEHDLDEDEKVENVEASNTQTSEEIATAEELTPVIDSLPSKDEEKIEDTTPEPLLETDSNISALETAVSVTSSQPTADHTPDALETTEVSANISIVDEPLSPTIGTSKILKSKFSTQDLKTEPSPASNSPNRITRENSPIIVTEKDEEEENNEELPETKQHKRKTNIEPIKTDFAEDKDRLSDDEDLMEELHSATLHEAKPMTVAKSPVTPVFPSPTKGERSPTIVRTVSNPVHGKLLAPGDVTTSSARSVSSGAAYLHKVAQQPNGPSLTRKSTVGSSISQRIKALEKLSASTGESTLSPTPTPSSRERPSSAFFSVRRSREPTRSPSIADRASSFNRQNLRTPPSRSGSRDESPDRARKSHRERSNSVASRLSKFESHAQENGGSPESISVTARIVRDPSQNAAKSLEPPKDPSEFNPVELKESPLLVDHQKASPVWTPAALEHSKETILERRMSKEGRRSESKSRDKEDHSRRSSLSVVKDFINDRRKSLTSPSSDAGGAKGSQSPTRPPSTHQGKRLSISSRRSSISRDRDNVLSPTATTESSASGDETKSNSEKKKSRAGRFMRRLSSLSSSRGKTTPPTILSPTVHEEMAEPVRPATTAGPPSIVSYMGDVNVQFPDNLLWKRRNMCLDSQGFLILSALPAQSSRTAQGTKRYHMSDFRSPYIPDVEVQELPNSVVLDLVDGSSVQLACMDRSGQMGILDVLQEAHARHATSFSL
ncbi:hypothetical protein IWW34DRAFT_664586 [Fusarium oxysporum f. sp. albedinis]|nr:hypothetical protein IWW34DRAFT_664586 [Fusarium oxysporum f. sp. albedinis]KAJ0127744.1 hypothetical protein HZ326_29151 [Fusarium oxysporum f. sp. albedinis]KAK2475551.1 hypothetical protein H9L39_13144 [Fusarium oxysporum f. sp. albedinis]